MTVDKTYCINLDRRPDRWQLAQEQFNKHGLQVERFAAIDGKDFKAIYPADNANNGCTLSHYFLIERAKLLGLDTVMIFEDDVELSEVFTEVLTASSNDLPEDWDMLYFGGTHKATPTKITSRIYRANKLYTTHGYILRSTMFDLVIENFKRLDTPVDCFYTHWQKEKNVFVANPPIAWQRGGFSDIVGRDMHYPWIRTNHQ